MGESTKNIGQMIREARKQAGLTQKELSERLGVSVSAVTKMETRKAAHSVETLERVAKAIGKELQISFV